MLRKKKGQAAVEFLTTYGWAIMAILIAVGALYYFDVLSPESFSTVECETGPQLQCLEAALYADHGDFSIRIRNNHNIDVIAEIGVKLDNGQSINFGSNITSIPIGGVYTFNGTETNAGYRTGDNVEAKITLKFGRNSLVPYTTYGTARLKVVPGSPP